jgi:DNA polymerase-3 subunit epsilon
MEQRTLSAAYKFYCNKVLANAHSAEADAMATLEILHAQVVRYPEIGATIESILNCIGDEDCVDFARRMIKVDGIEIFNFGKHKGKVVAEVLKAEPQYYDWIMKGDFSLDTKQKLTEILNRTILKKISL